MHRPPDRLNTPLSQIGSRWRKPRRLVETTAKASPLASPSAMPRHSSGLPSYPQPTITAIPSIASAIPTCASIGPLAQEDESQRNNPEGGCALQVNGIGRSRCLDRPKITRGHRSENETEGNHHGAKHPPSPWNQRQEGQPGEDAAVNGDCQRVERQRLGDDSTQAPENTRGQDEQSSPAPGRKMIHGRASGLVGRPSHTYAPACSWPEPALILACQVIVMDLHGGGDLGYKKSMNVTDRTSAPWLCDWQPDADTPPLAGAEIRVLRVGLAVGGDDDPLEALPEWSVLADEERVGALRFVRPRDRRRFTVCRGSLRMILGRLLSRPAERLAFRSGPGGKPELAADTDREHRSSPRFNVTHSHELALIAVSLERELGVDLERIRSISESARIVESYFTPAELAQFTALDPSQRDEAFMRGWTRKEAILKAKGVGLAGLATAFETMFGTTTLSTRFTPAAPLPRVGDWSLWEAAAGDQYVAALAVADA